METPYFLQNAQGAYYPINGPTMLGRDATCQIRLADPEVSRLHALLWMERRILYLRDENTSNGTFLNELRLPPNQPVAVGVGNQVRVGQTVFSVVSLQPSANQSPVAAPTSAQPPRLSQNKLPLFLILTVAVLCFCSFALVAGYFLLQFWLAR